jgi:hypothetical protein
MTVERLTGVGNAQTLYSVFTFFIAGQQKSGRQENEDRRSDGNKPKKNCHIVNHGKVIGNETVCDGDPPKQEREGGGQASRDKP